MIYEPPSLPWHGIPSSKTGSTCRLYMMQAGGLALPFDLVLLPGPNNPNSSLDDDSKQREREMFFVPDFVFLIEHSATGDKYVFDLGMRKDLENSTPDVVKNVLPNFKNFPESLVDILKEHGTTEQQASAVKAVIFSHLHFDHIGSFGKDGFSEAELWIGPSSCTLARPGYPADEKGEVFSDDLPKDGSTKIVEFELPSGLLDEKRETAIEEALKKGNYEGIELRKPASGWFGLGAFERAFDLFDDGSTYLIDAPGHTAGHQMLLARVNTGLAGAADDFVLLAGDCYHHPAMLNNPLLTARPPFSKASMHSDPDVAIDTMFRAKRCAEEENIWVVAAHDFSVADAVSPETDAVKGLVLLTNWREKGWKHQ
jgi:glyoxylase-like metal-dependent hydrolase (beta-lactamase superfamily II)